MKRLRNIQVAIACDVGMTTAGGQFGGRADGGMQFLRWFIPLCSFVPSCLCGSSAHARPGPRYEKVQDRDHSRDRGSLDHSQPQESCSSVVFNVR